MLAITSQVLAELFAKIPADHNPSNRRLNYMNYTPFNKSLLDMLQLASFPTLCTVL